ncbi:MAG TPA: hypothetical protein VH761_09920 [Ilumatobacteraceae bacterium]
MAIHVGGDGTPTIDDPAITAIGTRTSADYKSIRQTWTLNGQTLDLSATNGGLARQLNHLSAVSSIAEITIAGNGGYRVTLPNGQVNVIWPTDDPTCWASITSGPALASMVDQIAAAVVHT